jgi:nucleotide-binding universal stress UspA family protein
MYKNILLTVVPDFGMTVVAPYFPADLIVMASHRPELKDDLLGANAARVVRPSKRSVLVVRN